jgi:regulator of protease activity HflC (stomatin/prohibitin superfamily)
MGISSVFSLVALLGFLLLLGGVALVVLSASQGRPTRGGVLMAAAGLVIGGIFSVISQSVVIIQPSEVAVVFNTVSGALERPRTSGTNIVLPVVQQATVYSVAQQEFTMGGEDRVNDTSDGPVRGRTVDGQEVLLDVTVIFNVDPTNVNTLHQRWQNRFVNDFIRPTARGFVRDVVSQFRADEIYGERRGELESGIQEAMSVRMQEEGLVLSDLLLRDITFSEQFTRAIEEAQIAEQQANQARLAVQRVQQEAEQRRAEAEGQRDAAVARAEGEAQSIVLRAEAEAEALRLVSEQIAANPSLIQYQYVQNLSDNVQLMLVPSNSPFLFDFASLSGLPSANPEFTAPAGTGAVPRTNSILPQATPEPTPAPGG